MKNYEIMITNTKKRGLCDTGMGLIPQREWIAFTNFDSEDGDGFNHFTGTGDTPDKALEKLRTILPV